MGREVRRRIERPAGVVVGSNGRSLRIVLPEPNGAGPVAPVVRDHGQDRDVVVPLGPQEDARRPELVGAVADERCGEAAAIGDPDTHRRRDGPAKARASRLEQGIRPRTGDPRGVRHLPGQYVVRIEDLTQRSAEEVFIDPAA